MPEAPRPVAVVRRFTERTVLVTGGASGIGRAAALRFASEGARVVVADHHEEAAREAAAEVSAAGAPGALGLACDVSRPDDVEACVGRTLAGFGGLDVIVNSAGVMAFKPFIALSISSPPTPRPRPRWCR